MYTGPPPPPPSGPPLPTAPPPTPSDEERELLRRTWGLRTERVVNPQNPRPRLLRFSDERELLRRGHLGKGKGNGGDTTRPPQAMPRAEDFHPTARAFEVDHLLNADVHVVPKPSPSKPPGAACAGVYWAPMSSFPSAADPPGSFAAEAGTTTQTVIGAGHRVGVPLASLHALDAWFNPHQ